MLNVKHSMNIFLNICLVAGKLNCFYIEKVKKKIDGNISTCILFVGLCSKHICSLNNNNNYLWYYPSFNVQILLYSKWYNSTHCYVIKTMVGFF